jgi:predicted GH43/DUF377 family glycosyl hydrolase
MKPLPDSVWEYNKIGIAGPPIKTEQGWFLIYHGTSNEKGYCLGAALLDLDNPSKVLARQTEPILEPLSIIIRTILSLREAKRRSNPV